MQISKRGKFSLMFIVTINQSYIHFRPGQRENRDTVQLDYRRKVVGSESKGVVSADTRTKASVKKMPRGPYFAIILPAAVTSFLEKFSLSQTAFPPIFDYQCAKIERHHTGTQIGHVNRPKLKGGQGYKRLTGRISSASLKKLAGSQDTEHVFGIGTWGRIH